jgi:hypothetical protein
VAFPTGHILLGKEEEEREKDCCVVGESIYYYYIAVAQMRKGQDRLPGTYF